MGRDGGNGRSSNGMRNDRMVENGGGMRNEMSGGMGGMRGGGMRGGGMGGGMRGGGMRTGMGENGYNNRTSNGQQTINWTSFKLE